MPTSTATAIEVSLGPVEQEIQNAVEEGIKGFRNGWISSIELNRLLINSGKARMIPRNRRSEVLESLGYKKIGRVSREVAQEDCGRPILYANTTAVSTGDVVVDYMNAQGYIIT